MARFVKSVLCLLVVLSIVSCATTSSIETNKNVAYSEPIKKLFVVINTGDWKYIVYETPEKPNSAYHEVLLSDYLAKKVEEKVKVSGVEVKADKVEKLELGLDRINKERDDFGATWVMSITLTWVGINGYGYPLKCTYDVSILDEQNAPNPTYPVVWRATVATGYMRGLDPDKTVDNILSGLIKDGLISTHAPLKSS